MFIWNEQVGSRNKYFFNQYFEKVSGWVTIQSYTLSNCWCHKPCVCVSMSHAGDVSKLIMSFLGNEAEGWVFFSLLCHTCFMSCDLCLFQWLPVQTAADWRFWGREVLPPPPIRREFWTAHHLRTVRGRLSLRKLWGTISLPGYHTTLSFCQLTEVV